MTGGPSLTKPQQAALWLHDRLAGGEWVPAIEMRSELVALGFWHPRLVTNASRLAGVEKRKIGGAGGRWHWRIPEGTPRPVIAPALPRARSSESRRSRVRPKRGVCVLCGAAIDGTRRQRFCGAQCRVEANRLEAILRGEGVYASVAARLAAIGRRMVGGPTPLQWLLDAAGLRRGLPADSAAREPAASTSDCVLCGGQRADGRFCSPRCRTEASRIGAILCGTVGAEYVSLAARLAVVGRPSQFHAGRGAGGPSPLERLLTNAGLARRPDDGGEQR